MYNAVVPSFPRKKQPPENSWGVTRLRQPKATCHWTVLVHEFQSTLCMSLQNFTGLLFHKLLYVPAVQSHCWLGDLVSAAMKLSQVSQFGHGGVCVSTGVWIKNKKKKQSTNLHKTCLYSSSPQFPERNGWRWVATTDHFCLGLISDNFLLNHQSV